VSNTYLVNSYAIIESNCFNFCLQVVKSSGEYGTDLEGALYKF